MVTRPWISGDRGEALLSLPVDPRDMLPRDHRVWDVLAIVDELDLTAFEVKYRVDGQGRPPYEPRVMVGLLVYCYGKGIISGVRIAAACHDDLGCRVITGGRYPGVSTVNGFLTRFSEEVKALLVQTLRIGKSVDLVDVSVVAGDGTYLDANASPGAAADEKRLGRQIDDLQERVNQAEKSWQEAVGGQQTAIEDEKRVVRHGDDPRKGPGVSGSDLGRRELKELRNLSRRLQERRSALAQLLACPGREWRAWTEQSEKVAKRVAKAEAGLATARSRQEAVIEKRRAALASGRRIGGKPPVPVEQHVRVRQAREKLAKAQARAQEIAEKKPGKGKINTTDPDSAVMPGKRGGFRPRYNVQALCCRNQFVIAIDTHPSSNDKQALKPLLARGRANLDAAGITDSIQTALFDCGYASDANFTGTVPVKKLLVSVEQEKRQTGRDTDPVTDNRSGDTVTSTAASTWGVMTERMSQPENAALYKQRSPIVEPFFAQLFARFGRSLTRRTLDDVTTEIHLWAVVHNLHKIMRRKNQKKKEKPATSG